MHAELHANVSNDAPPDISDAKRLFYPPRKFSQITKPRSKPLALQRAVASTRVSIVSSQAILLKVLDARKLLTAAVNTSL